jgi:hypothetical protein
MHRWKVTRGTVGATSLLCIFLLTSHILEAEASKFRSWLEKNQFVAGNEPVSGQTAVQVGGKLYFISGTHGSGTIASKLC